jgi:hypothetical protein
MEHVHGGTVPTYERNPRQWQLPHEMCESNCTPEDGQFDRNIWLWICNKEKRTHKPQWHADE